jgi:hypothetical protein
MCEAYCMVTTWSLSLNATPRSFPVRRAADHSFLLIIVSRNGPLMRHSKLCRQSALHVRRFRLGMKVSRPARTSGVGHLGRVGGFAGSGPASVVANRRRQIYPKVDCRGAAMINEKNQETFASEGDAAKAGL